VFFQFSCFFSLVFAAPRQQQQQISCVLEVSTIVDTWSSVSWFPSIFYYLWGFGRQWALAAGWGTAVSVEGL
jgi:hypothetical protein